MGRSWTSFAVAKVLRVVLALVTCVVAIVTPAQVVLAAPIVPPTVTDPRTLFQTKLADRSRSLGFPIAVHLTGETTPQITLPTVSPRALETIDRNSSDGLTAFGVWTAPNRVLLRWMPEGEWIPDEGYTVFRQVPGGKVERLVDGLGAVNPTSEQVQTTQEQIRKSGKDLILYPMEAAVGETTPQPDNLTTTTGLRSFVTDLHNQTKVTDAVRTALQDKNLLGTDQSNRGVEAALTNLVKQKPGMPREGIVSGAPQFNARAAAAALGDTTAQLPAQREEDHIPVVANRLLQAVTQASDGSPLTVGALGNTSIGNFDPDRLKLQLQDPVENLLANRRSAKTLANSNYQAALASGLGYVDDQLPNLKKGEPINYWVVTTSNRQILLSSSPQITVEYGLEQVVNGPTVLAGYGVDGAAYLRWQQPNDEFSRSLLAGYMVERSDDGRNFRVVNPEGPVLVSYRQDRTGKVYEPEHFYTDTQVSNRRALYYYRAYAVDVFGRETERSAAIDLTVFKTTAPPAPILSKPVLITADKSSVSGVLGTAATRTYGPEDWLDLKQRRVITEQQYQALNRLGTVTEEQLRSDQTQRSLVSSDPTLARDEVHRNLLEWILGRGSNQGQLEENERRRQVEAKADQLRQPGQAGIIVNFTQSLEPSGFEGVKKPAETSAQSPKMQLARDLKEYRIYRSVAQGSQPYELPPQLIATISPKDTRFTVSPAVSSTALDFAGERPALVTQQPEADSEIVYVDTQVQEGHYYAYWVTAADVWGNESAMQEEPQIVGYATKAVPSQPQNLRATFKVDEAIERINGEKVAGFSVQAKQPADIVLRNPASEALAATAERVLDIAQSFDDFYGIHVVGADELHADGSITVRWIPDINTNPLGYQVWRSHNPSADPASEAARDGLTVSAMMRMPWTLLKTGAAEAAVVPQEAAVAHEELDSVIIGTQITDKVPLPARGTYYYLIRRVYPKVPEPVYSPFVPGGEVTLIWDKDPNPQIVGYRVYRRDMDLETQLSAPNAQGAAESKWVMVEQLIRDHRYVETVAQSRAHAYQYKVRAVTVWGVESLDSLPCQPVRINSTIPPEVPTLLTPVPGPGSVTIRWQPVDEASRYLIHRSIVPEVGPRELASVINTVGGLKYAISISPERGPAAYAQEVMELVADMNMEQRLELWGAVRGRYGPLALAPYYKLSYQDAASVQWTRVGEVSATAAVMAFTDTTASYPGSYLYAVEAINDQDRLSSGLSKPVSASPQKSVGPNAPRSVTVTPMVGGGLKLTWPAYPSQAQQAVPGQSANDVGEIAPRGYLVYRAAQESGPYHQSSELLTTNEYLDTSVLDGQQYWYRVVILDEVGLFSAPSQPVLGKRAATTRMNVRLPLDLTPSLVDFQPDVRMATAPTIIQRLAVRLSGSEPSSMLGYLTAPRPPLPVTKLLPPSNVTAEATGTTVTVAWSASKGAAGYTVYGYKTEQPEVVLGTVGADKTSLVVSGLSPKTTYFLYVVASGGRQDSLPSTVVKVVTGVATETAVVTAPSRLTAVAIDSEQVALTWQECPGVDGYRIYGYRTELQPVELLATVGPKESTYTVKGLKANTEYFFYVTGYTGKIETSPSKVAKVRTLAGATTPQLPTTLRVGGYTIRNVSSTPPTSSNTRGETIGQLEIQGIPAVPVKLVIQQLNGDQLVQGRVLLGAVYDQPISRSNARVRLTDLQLSPGQNGGLAQVSGLLLAPGLAVPGYEGILLSANTLTPSGTISIPLLPALWVGEDELADLQTVTIDLVGQRLASQSSKLLTRLGQVTVDTNLVEMRGQQTVVDFAGRLTGSFSGSGELALAVPKGLDIDVRIVRLTFQQGVVDEQSSSLTGKITLPFITKESTITVVGPGPEQDAIPNPTEKLEWGAIVSNANQLTRSQGQVSFSALMARSQTARQTSSQQQGSATSVSAAEAILMNQSLSYLLEGVGSRSVQGASVNPSVVKRQAAATSQSSEAQSGFRLVGERSVTTITEREFASVSLAIANWDGQGLSLEQAGPLPLLMVDEQLAKNDFEFGRGDGGSNGINTDPVQMEAEFLSVNLPRRSLLEGPERVSLGSADDPGLVILQGKVHLPSSVVSMPDKPDNSTGEDIRFSLPISSDIQYGRNGFWGRLDTESETGMNVTVHLNKTEVEVSDSGGTQTKDDYVLAQCTSASVEMLDNQYRATLKGTLAVPQVQKIFRYQGHNDPQGGWMFALANEDGTPMDGYNQDPNTSVVFGGGRLDRWTVLLNGTMNAVNRAADGTEELRVDDLKFVGMAVYIGQIPPQPPAADAELPPIKYAGLATQPTPAKLQQDTVTATGVSLSEKIDKWGNKVFCWATEAAVSMADNLPLNEGCELKVGASFDSEEDKYSINFLYTHEDFMTISAVLFLDAQSKEFAGSGTFWFASIGSKKQDGQKGGTPEQRGGEVKVRVGKFTEGPKQGDTFWMAKVGYGESGKKWQCKDCKFIYHSVDKPKICVMAKKDGTPCKGKKFEDPTAEQQKDMTEAEKKEQKQKEFEDRGFTIGPLSIKSLTGLVGYNMKPPIGKNGTFEIPAEFGSMTGAGNVQGKKDAFFTWPTQADGNVFFIATGVMTIEYGGQELFTLNPVSLVVATGPSVEIEAKVMKGDFFLAYTKMGYYHLDRRFFMDTRLGYMQFGPYQVEGLGLGLDISPKRQAIYLSYPEILHVILPPSPYPWTFGGGLGFERDGSRYTFMTKAMFGLDTGEKKLADWFYLRAYVTLTGGLIVSLEFVDGKIQSIDDIDFALQVWLEICLKAGVIVNGKKYEVIKAGAELFGEFARRNAVWEVTGRCTLFYAVDLIFWEKSGSIMWEISESYAG